VQQQQQQNRITGAPGPGAATAAGLVGFASWTGRAPRRIKAAPVDLTMTPLVGAPRIIRGAESAGAFDELTRAASDDLMEKAKAYQDATGFHLKYPPGFATAE
jgi:hypothetical protein